MADFPGKLARLLPVAYWLFIAFAIACVLSVVLIIFFPKTADTQLQCKNNMRTIGLAIRNYESAHQGFPPAFTTDDSGKRLHSWRVLILPYLEEQSLFDKFDLDLPWNHPVNLPHAKEMPWVYRCPECEESTSTSYLALVGTRTVWSDGKMRFVDVPNAKAVAMIAELDEHSVHWMSPEDLIVDAYSPDDVRIVSGPHGTRFNITYVDSSTAPSADSFTYGMLSRSADAGSEPEQ